MKDVPYFQRLSGETNTSNEETPPTTLAINDNHVILQSIVDAIKYIYTDYCFTSNRSRADDFQHFVEFIQSRTLAFNSFNAIVEQLTQHNCVASYRLGTVFNISPLQRKAWKQAVTNNWLQQMAEMITPYSNIDDRITNQLQTALHISIERGYTIMVQTLISAGCNVNLTDYKGNSALGLAVWYGHIELTQTLLDNGAELDSVDQYEQTPLHKACAKGFMDIVLILVQHGANPNLFSHDGYTPLHMAATGGKAPSSNCPTTTLCVIQCNC